MKYMPSMAVSARTAVFPVGSFLSSRARMIGVITMDSCTIKAVFDPEVRPKASIQKVLLNTETRHTRKLVNKPFKFIAISLFPNTAIVQTNPQIEHINKIEN
jgi:hypothetical protein